MKARQAFPPGSEPVPGPGPDLFSRVQTLRDATEGVFLTTGSQLIEVAGLLDTARQGALSLDGMVQGDILDRLHDEAARQSSVFGDLAQDFATVDAGVGALSLALDHLRGDLQDLGRSVVTMRMVVLNARVTLAALQAQEQRRSNFAEDGQAVVAETVRLLNRFDEALLAICLLAGERAQAVRDIRGTLAEDVLAAFRRLMRDVESFEAGVRSVGRQGTGLSQKLQGLMAATAAAVSGLQVGDTTRQKLDHVAFILSLPDAADPALRALSEALVVDAATLHGQTLEVLRQSVGDMIAGIKDLIGVHLAGFLDACGKTAAPEVLTEGNRRLEAAIGTLHPLQAKALTLEQAMVAEFEVFRDLIRRGEDVQHSTRQIGINAVLFCTRLGSDGMALKVVAEQLQVVSHEVGGRFSAMRTTLDRVGALVAQTTAAIDHALRNSVEMPERLARTIGPLIESVTANLLPVNTAVTRLRDRLADLDLDFGPVLRHAGELRMLADGLAPPKVMPATDRLPDETLTRIAGVFSIEREREIFRNLLPDRSASPTIPARVGPGEADDGFLL